MGEVQYRTRSSNIEQVKSYIEYMEKQRKMAGKETASLALHPTQIED